MAGSRNRNPEEVPAPWFTRDGHLVEWVTDSATDGELSKPDAEGYVRDRHGTIAYKVALPHEVGRVYREIEMQAELAVHEQQVEAILESAKPLIREVHRLRHQADQRVTYGQAIAGVPELGLEPTPGRTLRRWVAGHSRELGVNRAAGASTQEFLVSGLRALHANPRRRACPPQHRK